MTPIQKRAFIDDLVNNVHESIVERIDDMPDDWDGHELRRYIADKFSEQNGGLMPGCVRSSGNSIRMRNYRNEILVRNL